MNQPQKPNGNKFRFIDRPYMWLIIISVLMALWVIPVLPIAGAVILYMYASELASFIKKIKDADQYKKDMEELVDYQLKELDKKYNDPNFMELQTLIKSLLLTQRLTDSQIDAATSLQVIVV